MHLLLVTLVFLAIALHPAHALHATQRLSKATQAQLALDICPSLKVNCVIDGDWRHPVGTLGSKRGSFSPAIGSLRASSARGDS